MDSYRKNMSAEIDDIGFSIEHSPARPPHGVGIFDGRHDGVAADQSRRATGYLRIARTTPGVVGAARRRSTAWAQAWFTVNRQAFSVDELEPVGLYFGTTGGELWMSPDEGYS